MENLVQYIKITSPPGKDILEVFLRVIILINALYQVLFGEVFFGFLALAALTILLIPRFFY
nr:hypothetical protein [Methanobacterium formicicum]